MKYNKSCHGFTLVELAVVLVIVGLLMGGFIGSIGARIDTQHRTDTKDALDDIKTALYGFAMSQSPTRLPCPDINNDGIEDSPCGALSTPGNLPWVTLGIKNSDAWSSVFSYWVADVYSNSTGFDLASTANGKGEIRDSASGTVIARNIAAVVFSHGKNQYGGIDIEGNARVDVPANTTDSNYDNERENQDVDATDPVVFVSRPVTDESAPIVFDDILTWISEFELKARMVDAGVIPK